MIARSAVIVWVVAAAACGTDPPCPHAALAPLPRSPAYAVVTSDFQSTAIALLDSDGALVTEAWLDSGTTEPGIVATLTGDVTLPTEPWPGELVAIDRFGVDVITRIEVPTGRVLGQLPTRSEQRSGYRPNPQDVVRLDATHALVSRHEPNRDPGAPELDRGDDLIVVDLEASRVVERIGLEHLAVENGADPIRARPSRMVRRGAHVVVGLARLSDGWTAGPGAVAVVDPDTGAATETPLDGLRDCGIVRAAPDSPTRVLVLCAGQPFETGTIDAAREATRRSHAGVAIVEVAPDGTAEVTHLWRAADHPSAPVPTSSLVPLGGTRALATAMGDEREDRPDRVVAIDLSTGAIDAVLEAPAFAIGLGQLSPAEPVVLLPDATAGVRRVHADGFELSTKTDPSPCRALPSREVGAIISM